MSAKVYLIARSSVNIDALHAFLADQNTSWRRTADATPPEELVEFAGRLCYMSFGSDQSPRTNTEYIRRLISMGHESVLEHVSWTFLLTGISRAFSHQLVRHRVGIAFSQLSQQYHDETNAEFVQPSHLEQFPAALAAWRRAVQVAKDAYREILASLEKSETILLANLDRKETRRAIRSAARSVLPNATETKILMTANGRALRHFLRVRGTILGDAEMRQVSAQLLKYLHEDAYMLFSDFKIELLCDSSPIIVQERSDDNLE